MKDLRYIFFMDPTTGDISFCSQSSWSLLLAFWCFINLAWVLSWIVTAIRSYVNVLSVNLAFVCLRCHNAIVETFDTFMLVTWMFNVFYLIGYLITEAHTSTQ